MSRLLIHRGDPAGRPVVVGCPFSLTPGAAVARWATVTLPDGREAAAQCHVLATLRHAPVQWVELSFVASGLAGEAQVRLHAGAAADGRRLARDTDAGVVLSAGEPDDLSVTLARDAALPPLTVAAAGACGTLAPEVVLADGSVCRDSGAHARAVAVTRNGAIRARTTVTGQLTTPAGAASLSYRLSAEVWHGCNAVRVDWMLMHLAAGVPRFEIARATLVGDWQVGHGVRRQFAQTSYGDYYRRRVVANADAVALVAGGTCGPVHVEDAAMLLDDAVYARYLPTPTTQTEDWLALSGSRGAVLATLQDFAESRPNRLYSRGAQLSYDLIPAGETTAWPQGRRREQRLFFAVGAADAPEALRRAAVALDTCGRAQPTRATLETYDLFDMRQLLAWERGRNPRFHAYLSGLCKLDTPADKWGLGDTVDDHYTRSYAAIPNRYERRAGAPDVRPVWLAGGGLAPWCSSEYLEPVWTNNEYDIVHVLAQELCRAGDGQLFTPLRWFARHTVEVDFVAYSDDRWHHRATPAHSPHHNSTGAYPSHFWTQGLLQYYLLTGDDDALEVAEALGDKTVECLTCPDVCPPKFDREHGWGLLALVCLCEYAGLDRFMPECARVTQWLMDYDRDACDEAINLSAGDAAKCMDRQIVDCAFGYFAMVEAVDRYARVAGRADVDAWLVDWLKCLKTHAWDRVYEGIPGGLTMAMMAIGYEHTGDRDFLDVAMVGIDAAFGPFSPGVRVAGETKACATAYRAVQRMLGHLDRAGMLEQFDYPTLRDVRRRRTNGSRAVE